MKLILLRHGKTAGNLEGRYVGATDEPLCKEGLQGLQLLKQLQPQLFQSQLLQPQLSWLAVSPMERCRQTADFLCPGREQHQYFDFREMNFGDFEGKNNAELTGNPDYQAWIDSRGKIPFPNGESREVFSLRCREAFIQAVNQAMEADCKTTTFVVHGGTIMAILESFAHPYQDFYSYQTANAAGFLVNLDEKVWTERRVCCIVNRIGGEHE